uniref:DNA_mis_repair domain-containing protein n=1 Tax=Syphacia muris TaxID=451379 RepID=A0A158R598_9BILA
MLKNSKQNCRSIKLIPADVRRKISTGQVVVTLAGACKELVDNSLDAGATLIDIRAKNFGADLLEVNDNGVGIKSDDFDQLCKPHSTSKLDSIRDFDSLRTFGFRGEALNALCALSSVTITTRHQTDEVGTKLTFDHNGDIVAKERCIGTLVAVKDLFAPIPVRRKELERTARKEFNKLLTAVQAFAFSRTDIRFCVNTLLSPGNNASIKDVIVSLFGSRAEKGAILEIAYAVPDEDVSFFSLYWHFIISGYISSCAHGHGRSSNDRQFIFFNKRPVVYPKLCRVANEVYQMYNAGQYCMLILFVNVPPDLIDVNVSPDKQTVFFEREKDLLALLRSSLLATFVPVFGQTETLPTNKAWEKESQFGYEQGCSGYKRNTTRKLEDFAFTVVPHIPSNKPSTETCDDRCTSSSLQDSIIYNFNLLVSSYIPFVKMGQVYIIFRKDDFEEMEVIGQFNKGFIITRLRGDLFIVDQHASDEKYNFERFQKHARIQSQSLLRPLPLGLGSFEESLLRDHIDVFNYNGFEFQINDDGCFIIFMILNLFVLITFLDIDEMLSVLREFPGTMYRPTKLRKLFALRACRKSVMIGTALSVSNMEKNCPHGRPTLRHLCSLNVCETGETRSVSFPENGIGTVDTVCNNDS